MTEPVIIAGMISAAVGIVFWGIYALRSDATRKDVVSARLKGHTATATGAATGSRRKSAAPAPKVSIVRDEKFSEIPFLNALLGGAAFAGMLRLWLLQARIKTSPGAVVLVTLLLAAAAGVSTHISTGSVFMAAAGFALGGSIPVVFIQQKRAKRFRMFAQQLPDALTMMKNSLQAGHTLDRAMQVISEEMPDPVALEFRETVEELHLGVPVKRAMENFNNRIIDENLKIFVAALLVQREVGGNLTHLLGNLAGTIRERFRMEQEVTALTAEGRFSGYIVGALPIALGIIIQGMQPDYLQTLFTTDTGKNLLKLSFVLQVTGFYFIRRACRVNF